MRKTLVFYACLLRTSIKASISKRGAFLLEASFMIANNLIFFFIWWIFFRQFPRIAGWGFHEMLILLIVASGAWGLLQICFGNIKNLSRMIIAGELDPFMTQPKNLLLHIAGCKSNSKGWGNLLTSLILIILGGITSPVTLFLIFISILCGGLVFISASVIAHSLPFWMGSMEGVCKKYTDALFVFANYPTNIYSGWFQVVMFTFIPAGVISYLPVELVRQFTWIKLFILIASALSFFALAFLVFYSGLKKYESGNQFGTRL